VRGADHQCRGIVNSFGVFQTFFETDLLVSKSSSDISWIGSLQACLLLIIGVISGPLYDAGYFRHLLFAGVFLIVFGMMMTSLCTQYWQVVLAQGVCVGFGQGFIFIPSVAIVSQYFTTRKALAQGIASSGSSLAGIIYPIIFDRLRPRIGFGWATRVFAFTSLATLIIPLCFMKVRIPPRSKRALVDWSTFREMPFDLFTVGSAIGFIGIYVPFFYAPYYATSTLGVSDGFSAYTISILNAASIAGRLVANYTADKIGPLNVVTPFTLVASVVAFCWIALRDEADLIVFCIFYGFFTGCFVSLPPTVVMTLSPHLGVVGTRMGIVFATCGLGLLIGTPVAGAILGSTNDFLGVEIFCGSVVAISGCMLALTRIAKVGMGYQWA
jgi:MFS family permease